MKNIRIDLLLSLLLISILHLLTLESYPAPMVDEAQTASRTTALIQSSHAMGDLERGVLNLIPGSENLISKIPYYAYALISVLNGDISLFSLRLTNLIAGIILLFALYHLGNNLFNSKVALLTLLLTGFSAVFIFATHMARIDILATCWSFIILAFLSTNCSRLNTFILSLLFALGLMLHPRAIILAPLIPAIIYYQERKILSEKQFISLIAGLGGFAIYYYFSIYQHQIVFSEISKITLGNSRTPPILNFNLSSFLISWQGFIHSLKIDYLIWLILAEAICCIYQRQAKDLLILTILLLITVSSLAMISFIFYYQAIIFLPCYTLIAGHFLYRVLNYSKLKIKNVNYGYWLIFTYLAVILTTNTIRAVYFSEQCLQDYDKKLALIKDNLKPGDKILGVPTFWTDLKEYQYQSWENLVYHRNYHEQSSISDAVTFLNPDLIIYDAGIEFYLKDEVSDNPAIEGLRLNRSEFIKMLKEKAQLKSYLINTCDGPFKIFRINK